MGVYLTIGFLVGIVMVGVYWGLPEGKTGPKGFGRIVLILITAPFLWPVQLAFYATKFLSGAHNVASASDPPTHILTGAPNVPSEPSSSNDSRTIKAEISPMQTCIGIFHNLREQVVGTSGRYLPDERAADSKFIGAVLGMIDVLAHSEHVVTADVVEPIMRDLFGPACEDAMVLVRAGPDDGQLMASLEAVQIELSSAELGSRKMFSLLGSIWRRCYSSYGEEMIVLPEDIDPDAPPTKQPPDEDIVLSAGMPDIAKRRPVRSYHLGPYSAHVFEAPPLIGDGLSGDEALIEYVYVMAVAPVGFYGSPFFLVTAERTAGAIKELLAPLGADATSIRLCYFDSTGHYNVGSFEGLDDKKVFSQHALAIVCKQLRLSGTPRQV